MIGRLTMSVAELFVADCARAARWIYAPVSGGINSQKGA